MIEKLGDHISGKVDSRPAVARRMLAAAWSLVGWKGSHFPSKERCASHEYLQAVVSNLLSKMIRNSKDAAFVNIFMPCEIFHAMDMKVMTPEAFSIYIATRPRNAHSSTRPSGTGRPRRSARSIRP